MDYSQFSPDAAAASPLPPDVPADPWAAFNPQHPVKAAADPWEAFKPEHPNKGAEAPPVTSFFNSGSEAFNARDPRLAAAAARKGTTPEKLGGEREAQARLFLQGAPVAGNFVPSNEASSAYEAMHPSDAAAIKMMGGLTATAPLAGFAPEGLGAQMLYGGATQGGLTVADSATRDVSRGKPVDWNRAIGEGLGSAEFGAGGAWAGHALGSVVMPEISNASQYLLGKNVPLSIGQTLGGQAKRYEDIGHDFPILGGAIRGQRDLAAEGFDRAIANETLSKLDIGDPKFAARGIQTEVPTTYPSWHEQAGKPIGNGYEARAFTRENIQRAYDTAYDGVNLPRSAPMWADMTKIGEEGVSSGVMTEDIAKRYDALIRGQIQGRFDRVAGRPAVMDAAGNEIAPKVDPINQGRLNRDAVSNIDTRLRELSEKYSQGSGDDRILGGALAQARQRFNQEIGFQFPQARERLRAADDAWRHYAVMRSAGASTAVQGEEGLITPTQLMKASKDQDSSYENKLMSEGKATFQELALAGKQVLPSKVGNSGSPERLGTAAIAGYAVAEPHKGIPILGGLWGASQAYNPRVQAVLRQLAAAAPETRGAIRSGIEGVTPLAAGQASRQNALGPNMGNYSLREAHALARMLAGVQ